MTYQLTSGDTILRLSDNAHIPPDPGNRDYREYLDWLSEGNNPEPAPAPPPPGPDYIAFWDSLLISNIYQTIRTQALTSPAVLVAVTESLASLQDAKAGRPNVPAIQASINNLLAAGTFSQQDLAELGQLFVDANLQDTFTLEQP